jgi:hypothetical protein
VPAKDVEVNKLRYLVTWQTIECEEVLSLRECEEVEEKGVEYHSCEA